MTTDVGISFEANSFKEFNKALSKFEDISRKVDRRLNELAKGIDNVEISTNNLNKSFATFNSAIAKIDTGAIKNLIEAFNQIGGNTFSSAKIQSFATGFRTLMESFTQARVFGTSGNLVKRLIARVQGTRTIYELLNQLGSIDVEKIEGFSKAIRSLSISFNEIRKLDIPSNKVKEFTEGFRELLKSFTSAAGRGFAPGRFLRNLTGTQTIFELFSKIDFSGVEKLGSFTKSIRNIGQFFDAIGSINFNTNNIKEFGKAMQLLVKQFSGRSIINRLTLGIVGRNSIFNQLSKIGDIKLGNLSNFSLSITRLVTTLEKINRIRVDPNKTKEIVKQIQELAKVTAQSFGSGAGSRNIISRFLNLGVDIGKGLISGFKKVLGISSPSKVFQAFGKNTIEGFANGVKGALGLLRGAFSTIVTSAKRIVSPITGVFSFIKDRMVFTFADLQRIARSTFNTIIGTTIEFESAFTGVLKTLDTSQIFAQSGEEGVSAFIEQLRTDLIGLSRDSDSMVAGLENSFVRLSSIAEAAGQLGVAAEDIVGFTDVIGQLSIATDLADEEAAFFLAKFTSITGDQSVENFQRLGGTIVNLGNNLAVTESQIATVAQRIAAAGSSAGLSQDQILAWSAAIRASGLNAEAGSTSFIQFSNAVTEAIASDDLDEIEQFSELIGLTGEQFAALFEEDPNQIFIDLLDSLGKLNRTELVALEDRLELDGIRLDQFIASMGAAQTNTQTLSRAMEIASDGMQEFGDTTEDFNALQDETSRRVETTEFKVNRMKNAWLSLSNTIGTVIQPVFNTIVDTITNIILGIEEFIGKVSGLGIFADALGIEESAVTGQQQINSELERRKTLLDEISAFNNQQDQVTTGFIEHQFVVGDTLFDLAQEHGITVQDILDFNDKTLEDFMGNISSVLIPIKTVDADTGEDFTLFSGDGPFLDPGFTGSINPFGAGFGPGGSALNELSPERVLERMREQLDEVKESLGGVGDGFRDIISGDIKSGLRTIANSLGDAKDNIQSTLDIFLEGAGVDTEGLDFAQTLIVTFNELFGVDLTPVYEVVKEHYIDILAAGFALITGNSIGLAIPVVRILLDILSENFGDIDSETGPSGFAGIINNFIGDIGGIISEALGNIDEVISGQGTGISLTAQEFFSGDQVRPDTGGATSLIAPITQIIAGAAGELAAAFGELFVSASVELVSDIPTLVKQFAETIVIPFLGGLVDEFKSAETVTDVADAILGLLKSAVGLVFGVSAIASFLGGGGIVGSVAAGFGTLFSTALALINPATIVAAGAALIVGMIASEEFRDAVFAELEKLWQSVFGQDWRMELEESITNFILPVASWIVGAIEDVKNFVDVLFHRLEFALLDLRVKLAELIDRIPGVDVSGSVRAFREDRDAVDREIYRLELLQDLRKGGDEGVLAFQQLGGNIFGTPEDIQAQIEELGIAPIFAESVAEDIGAAMPEFLTARIQEAVGTALQDTVITDEEALQLESLFSIDPEVAREAFNELQPILQESLDFIGRGEEGEEQLGLISGIIDGLNAGVESEDFVNATAFVGSETERLLRDSFESQSPSQLTARIGRDVVLGLEQGMRSATRLLQPAVNSLIFEIGKIGGAAEAARQAVAGLQGAIQSLVGVGFSVSVSGSSFGGGRQFGGGVTEGRVYEILEGDLPFELFRSAAGRTFMLANESGNIVSPAGNFVGAGGGGGGSISNNEININVPVSFDTVPADISDAQLANISNSIANAVESRLQDGLRQDTLTDRLNRGGAI